MLESASRGVTSSHRPLFYDTRQVPADSIVRRCPPERDSSNPLCHPRHICHEHDTPAKPVSYADVTSDTLNLSG